MSRFIEQICSPLTAEIPNRIRDTSHLLDIIDDLNNIGLPNNSMLVSFDIVNMFPSIDNIKGMEAVKMALDSRLSKVPTTDCIMEGLEICLFNNNSKFADDNLLQTNGTATGAPNSCSYSDLAIYRLDKIINIEISRNFIECIFYGRYRDDCFI